MMMKKWSICLLCMLMLFGCQQKHNDTYEDIYQILDEANITISIVKSHQSIVSYLDDSHNEQWWFMLDNQLNVISVLGTISNGYVYGDQSIDNEALKKYKLFLEHIELSQKELNDFTKMFYQKNTNKKK